MTALQKIRAEAEEAAIGSLDPALIRDVRVEQDTDSNGDEILRVIIVLDEGAADRIDGDRFLSTLVSIKRRVRETGDDRRTLVEYATPSELDDDGNPES